MNEEEMVKVFESIPDVMDRVKRHRQSRADNPGVAGFYQVFGEYPGGPAGIERDLCLLNDCLILLAGFMVKPDGQPAVTSPASG